MLKNKHDAADAEAICEAVTDLTWFVPVKTAEQQAVLALHRSRQSFIKQRTAQANQIRGYWPNLALSSPEVSSRQRRLPELVEDADNPLPVLFRTQLSLLQHHMAYLFDVIATLDKQIEQCYRQMLSASVSARSWYWPCYRQRADCDHW
jgi:transposase